MKYVRRLISTDLDEEIQNTKKNISSIIKSKTTYVESSRVAAWKLRRYKIYPTDEDLLKAMRGLIK